MHRRGFAALAAAALGAAGILILSTRDSPNQGWHIPGPSEQRQYAPDPTEPTRVIAYSSKCDGLYDRFEMQYPHGTETYSDRSRTRKEVLNQIGTDPYRVEFAKCSKKGDVAK